MRLIQYGGNRALNPFYGPQVEIPVLLGDKAVLVDVRILRAYLPKLLKSRALDYDGTIDANQLIWRSENVQEARVRQAIMRNTLHKLIHSLVGEVEGSGGPQLRLISFLERTLHRQQMPYHRVIFGDTYQYFASLSEISRICNSERLAHVLEQFFSKFGSQIAAHESTYGMFDWTRAILWSNMKEAALCMCLREILTVRPNFDEEMETIALRSGSRFAMHLVQNIQETLARMTHSDFKPMDRGRAENRKLHQMKRHIDQLHYRQQNIEEVLGDVAERADAALHVSTAGAAYSDDEDFGGLASNWGDQAWD
jgi:hypothetical protein